MKVLYAPDFRPDNPYQGLLAKALTDQGDINMSFLSEYRRGLPLTRGVKSHTPDILHLHWPQRYFRRYHSIGDVFRSLRFGFDLAQARRRCSRGYVITAHNLLPHYDPNSLGVARNMGQAYRLADAVICHSTPAATVVSDTYRVSPEKLHVIPHGDLSPTLPPSISKLDARKRLHISKEEKIILMFGAQAPYKGIEEVLSGWKQGRPEGFTLCLAGAPHCEAYGHKLKQLIGNTPNIRWENRYLDDTELACWLDACDATLFNYRAILTSGGACLARSRGCPILLPKRLDTIDLGAESDGILFFDEISDSSFDSALMSIPPRQTIMDQAAKYRSECSWERVAELTRKVYEGLP